MKTEIIRRRGKYCVQITQGVQSFILDYKSTRKDEVEWMQKQLDYALNEFKNETLREFVDWNNNQSCVVYIPNSRIGRFNLENKK